MLCLASAAHRAFVAYYSGISAYRIAVNRVIDRSVADALLLHASDNLFKCSKICRRVSVGLNITDMSCVCKSMIWGFDFDFFKSADVVVNRNVE